jgi:hypothetical protein
MEVTLVSLDVVSLHHAGVFESRKETESWKRESEREKQNHGTGLSQK